jgi:salicylate hydroxylase
VATSRNVIIAGAGIGGLTAALALAQRGFRVTLLEHAERLEETGAGIQLSPNATRVLIALGLEERLKADVVVPETISIRSARGRELAVLPLGDRATEYYGAPYWAIHRADLQAILLEAVGANPDIELKLGVRVEDVVTHANGLTVGCRRGVATADEIGIALIGADGLWSTLRAQLGNEARPEFRHRTAWRALLPVAEVAPEFREPKVNLWLGRDAHLVHYPVKGGALVNIVAIVGDQGEQPGWAAAGEREEILQRFSAWRWAQPARALLSQPAQWLRWSLYDLAPVQHWGHGPITLLGDAAHPVLPFMAQGAAMAIEDAAVLAAAMARTPDDIAGAMRAYERLRRKRTAKVQRASRKNSKAYHLAGAEALARNMVLRLAGGNMLRRRYDWLYGWRPVPPKA